MPSYHGRHMRHARVIVLVAAVASACSRFRSPATKIGDETGEIVTDGSDVLVASTKGVVRIRRAGDAASRVSSDWLRALAVDATTVYAIDPAGARIVAFPKAGGPTSVLASGQEEASDLVVDETAVYWIANGAQHTTEQVELEGRKRELDVTSTKLSMVPKRGGTATELPLKAMQLAPTATLAQHLAADASGLYVTTWTRSPTKYELWKLPRAGDAVLLADLGAVEATHIALGPTDVFVGGREETNGRATRAALAKVPKAGGAVTRIAMPDDANYVARVAWSGTALFALVDLGTQLQASADTTRIVRIDATGRSSSLAFVSALDHEMAAAGEDVFFSGTYATPKRRSEKGTFRITIR